MACGPSADWAMPANRSAIVASASSQVIRAKRPSPLLPIRFIGCSSRWPE
jgi:hypothetical protein